MSKEVEGNPLRLMRIFKLFVCLSLILSISLINSFAAISVSDGSAFVTKAEFAADLNNLSNRMSSLENSLDAKIDSLVSSYLSRNGIWNGEKQTVLNYWVWNGTGTPNIKNSIPKPPTSIVSSTKYQNLVRYAANVFTSTKSGLLFAKYGIKIEDGYSSNYSISGVNYYTWSFSTCIAPTGSKWVGDYDGVAENSIAYSYPVRAMYSSSRNAFYMFSINGFVDKGVNYAIYIGMNSSSDSTAVIAFFTGSYLGFEPSFYVY